MDDVAREPTDGPSDGSSDGPTDGPTLAYEVLDVFTDRPFAGNPLAVVLGAEALSTAQMQALAAEFALSETAFPLRPSEAERARGVDYRLRIFTPHLELPFAGHPSVGTAWLLGARGRVGPGRVVQACGAGDLALDVAPGRGPVRLSGGAPTWHAGVDAAPLLAAVGLSAADALPLAPAVAGAGVEQVHLFVRPGALELLVPDHAALGQLPGRVRTSGPGPLAGLVVVDWGGVDGGAERASTGEVGDPRVASAAVRMFGTGIGVAEDPATGSAALGLGVCAVAAGLLPGEGASALSVSQGVHVGRPSRLEVTVEASGGAAVSVTVSGTAVPVAAGRVAVPPAG